MRYLSTFCLVAVLVGCHGQSTTPKAIPNEKAVRGRPPQSRSIASEAILELHPTLTVEHRSRVDLVVFAPNSRLLASESFTDGVKLTDAGSGKLLRALALRGYGANSLGFSHDGALLAIGTNRGEVELWDMATYGLRQTIPVTRWSIYAVALSPDGHTLASCAADGTVQVWDLHGPKLKQTLGSKGERMASLAFSRDGNLLATLSRYGKCCVWESGTGALVGEIAHAGDGENGHVSFPADGNAVAIVTPWEVTFWNPRLSAKSQVIRLPESIDPLKKDVPDGGGPVLCPRNTLSSDGETVATSLEDGRIAVWTVKTRTVQCILVGTPTPKFMGGGIEAMAFSTGGELLASANRNGKVDIWETMIDQERSSLPLALKGDSPATNQRQGQPNRPDADDGK